MQDAITNVINQADVQGLYLDGSAMGRLEQYFASGELRVRAAATISANGSAIIKEAVAKSLLYSDITSRRQHVHHPSLCSMHPRSGLLPALRNLRHAGWGHFHPR